MKAYKTEQTEIGNVPEEWEVAKTGKRFEWTQGAMEKRASDFEKRVNDHLSTMGFEV